MYFMVRTGQTRVPSTANNQAYLIPDNWDDWFEFETLNSLIVFDGAGERHVIGGIKIGQFAMGTGQRKPALPDEFDSLDADLFFSLGQDDSYYDSLNRLGTEIRDRILTSLCDVALNAELFERALGERVTGISLLRSVPRTAVVGQFRRMARGGARLTPYSFRYTAPSLSRRAVVPPALEFEVQPESLPPTNIHVLIGRNGVGKTTILNNITRAFVEGDADPSEVGSLTAGENSNEAIFTNLVSVTFSAFDPFQPLSNQKDKSSAALFSYVGLKRIGTLPDGRPRAPKSPESLSAEFGQSVLACRQGARTDRWRRALETLEADPIFKDAEIAGLASIEGDEDLKTHGRQLFQRLSSGHKIVLLTVTRLVETVEEKTLVLIDEPEAHLHPPLLAAFVRALSDLLINRNGVAIIATHSPVVLQEVPKSCVWKIRRAGTRVVAERSEIETFGENVGILTREVFGLEVTRSGFHKMLRDAVAEMPDLDAIVEQFGGELGGEARAVVRALLATRDPDEHGQ